MLSFSSADLVEGSVGTSSKGNQRKWRTRDGRYYIKECFSYQGKNWRDDMVELVATTYAQQCNLGEFGVTVLEQVACEVDGRPAVCSENFCSASQVFVSFKRLCDSAGLGVPDYLQAGPEDNLSLIAELYMALTGLNAYQYLLVMATLDTIVGNEDRHYNNFGVLLNLRDKSYSLPPLFDFGLGLFEHDRKYEGLPYKERIALMQCKPFVLENDRLVSFLRANHSDFLHTFLPASVRVSSFEFPSEEAESYFRNRNILLGVSLK